MEIGELEREIDIQPQTEPVPNKEPATTPDPVEVPLEPVGV